MREDNEKIFKVTSENAPENEKLTSLTVQKDIVYCFSKEIIKSICDEISKDVFAILVDDSSDTGIVKERFIGVVHVLDTSSLTLKPIIDTVFSNNNLSMAQVRGKGYDGASNMSGAFNVVVAVSKKHDDVEEFFEQLDSVVTVVCGSCKRKDMIREMQKETVVAEIGIGETEPGRGLNQEISFVQAGDTRWDMQIQDFGDKFSEVGMKLMENMAALSPCDLFSSFDKAKLLKLSEI
ncbi:uncharacterized protein LOC111915933 [Lactuca sativa]|uniref:uncharacterized protein LOC111915933 n=1 Tax=Lactuca sativa TaxID=4236 RepID=UPI0022AF8948|nr:uncharacterized protein LOC111915933 [Lactuca sativa]